MFVREYTSTLLADATPEALRRIVNTLRRGAVGFGGDGDIDAEQVANALANDLDDYADSKWGRS